MSFRSKKKPHCNILYKHIRNSNGKSFGRIAGTPNDRRLNSATAVNKEKVLCPNGSNITATSDGKIITAWCECHTPHTKILECSTLIGHRDAIFDVIDAHNQQTA